MQKIFLPLCFENSRTKSREYRKNTSGEQKQEISKETLLLQKQEWMHRIGVSGKGEKPLYRFDIRKAAEKLKVSQPLCAFEEMLLSERRLKDDAVFDAAF